MAGIGQEGALGAVGGLGVVARARQRLPDGVALGHVFGNPYRRALARVRRVDGTRQQAAQESAAVAAFHHPFDVHRLAACQRRTDLATQRLVGRWVGPDDGARLAQQCPGRIAEHLLELRIGELEDPLARRGNADRGVFQDRFAFEPLALDAGHITAIEHEVVAAVEREVRRRQQQQHGAALAVQHFDHAVTQLVVLSNLAHEVLTGLGTTPDADVQCRPADDLVSAPAGNARERIVDHHVAPGGQLGQRDQVGTGRDHVRHQRFGPHTRRLRAQALGVIVVDRQDGRAAAGLDLDTRHRGHHAAPVWSVQHELMRRRRFAYRQRVQGLRPLAGEPARSVFLVVEVEQAAADQRCCIGNAEQRLCGCIGVEHAGVAVQHQW